jgi:hypothetical protein
MAASTYKIWSATTAALTAPPVAVASNATANTVRTVQQLKATQSFRVIEWGYTLTALAPAPCVIELLDTGLIAATMATAYIAGDIIKYSNASQADTAPLTLGTGSSGFGVASAEGTITASRLLDFNYENGLYVKQQFPLNREAEVPAANYLRVRITPTTSVAVSIVSYITFEA